MKNNHIQTAVKALKRQYAKYEFERDKAENAEKTAVQAKEYFESELINLAEQIASLETSQKIPVLAVEHPN